MIGEIEPIRFVPLLILAIVFAVVWRLLGRSRYRFRVLRGAYVKVWELDDRREAERISQRLGELGWLSFANREPPADDPVTLWPPRIGELRPFVAVREQDAAEVRDLLTAHGGLPPKPQVVFDRAEHRGYSTWPFRWGHRAGRWYVRASLLLWALLMLAILVLRPLWRWWAS